LVFAFKNWSLVEPTLAEQNADTSDDTVDDNTIVESSTHTQTIILYVLVATIVTLFLVKWGLSVDSQLKSVDSNIDQIISYVNDAKKQTNAFIENNNCIVTDVSNLSKHVYEIDDIQADMIKNASDLNDRLQVIENLIKQMRRR
jgi:uncharacterized protein YoxC